MGGAVYSANAFDLLCRINDREGSMNRTPILSLILGSVLSLVTLVSAQVPQMINYQGRVAVGDPAVNFDGTGLFKFALVNGDVRVHLGLERL